MNILFFCGKYIPNTPKLGLQGPALGPGWRRDVWRAGERDGRRDGKEALERKLRNFRDQLQYKRKY